MSLADYKKRRAGAIEKLAAAADEAVNGKKYGNDGYWTPTRDKEGNAQAVIRFLPNKNPEDLAWVEYFSHSFQGPTGQWYIEKSRTTIGEDDPVGELNSATWNDSSRDEEERKAEARGRKRKQHYVSNIIVLSDPKNPDNEGKVFKYRYGKKIFEKIKDALQPAFADDPAFDPFDPFEGANFKVRVRKGDGGWPNYDKCEFGPVEELYQGDEDKLEEVFENLHDINELIDPATFKSYDELKKKMNRVLCIEADAPSIAAPSLPESTGTEPSSINVDDDVAETEDDSDDDSLSYFKSLADD